MDIQRNHIYTEFVNRNKNEPILIFQGSKRSGKTTDRLIEFGALDIFQKNGVKIQCFSESPKQQNHGMIYDFERILKPVLWKFKKDGTQHTYKYKDNELSFINIPNNIRAGDVANSLGRCDTRFIDECNMYAKSTFEKLMINNTGQMFLAYNPWRQFWVNELINDHNFLKTTWRDNIKFLSENQIALFEEWTRLGKISEIGSYNYWRWQVMCEGEFAELTGSIFTTENTHFTNKLPDGLHRYIIFADPSNASGWDYFALTLTAIGSDGKCYVIDTFSCNLIEKALIAEKIRQWQHDYPVERTFIETNGEYGLKFYNDCIIQGIKVDGWYSRNDKFERIMANFDVITDMVYFIDTEQNREFARQIYTFRHPDEKDENGERVVFHDDNVDCLNNAIIAYITLFHELKVLF